jgi:hypothetical protein
MKEMRAMIVSQGIVKDYGPQLDSAIEEALLMYSGPKKDAGKEPTDKQPPRHPPLKKLERLKGYVSKCGVRKTWKKELEGLDTDQAVEKISKFLEDLGMEGMALLLSLIWDRSTNSPKMQGDQEKERI